MHEFATAGSVVLAYLYARRKCEVKARAFSVYIAAGDCRRARIRRRVADDRERMIRGSEMKVEVEERGWEENFPSFRADPSEGGCRESRGVEKTPGRKIWPSTGLTST